MDTKSKKVLITGIGGYLGSTITQSLMPTCDVVGFGLDSNFNLLREKLNSDIKLVAGDINDQEKLEFALQDIDVIVHTAGVVGDKACGSDPWTAIKTNIRGTRTLASSLKEVYGNDTPPVIHISTQSVYGTFAKRPMPLTEEMDMAPDDFYGATKAEAEYELANTPAVILRLTNLYGYGVGIGYEKNVVSRFVKMILSGEAITIFGDGSQGIDFIHVKDVADVVSNIITSMKGRSIESTVYNVGGGRATPMKDVAENVLEAAKEVGKEGKILYKEAPEGKVWPTRWLDNRKIMSLYPDLELKEMKSEIVERFKAYESNAK